MQSEERFIIVYKAACDFLNRMTPHGIDLGRYYVGDNKDYNSLNDIFFRFIVSAQNYQSMPNVIGFEKRKEAIKELLYNFDYNKIKDVSANELYYSFRERFQINSADSKRNSWYKWSCSIVDSAKFISEFSDVKDFKSFVNRFDYNVSTRMALPLLISTKIKGIGFALACDTLKELGFTDYPKPDTHLREVFVSTNLSDKDDYSIFEAITKMAKASKRIDNDVTPYKVDKVFWLICSGKYYLEKPTEITVKGMKKELIELINSL